MSTLFTADSHFGHRNILKYDKTRNHFTSLEEHDEHLIEQWNQTVGPGDTVYHLGDFTFSSDWKKYYDRLKGNIHLILGNHDKKFPGGFASIQDVLYLKNENLFLSHYPHYSWNKSYHGVIHLFGHVHETFKFVPGLDPMTNKNLNVGVTWHKFRPISLDEVRGIFK